MSSGKVRIGMTNSQDPREKFATSEFLATAAHDMCQPLHGLNLLLAALASRADDAVTAALVKGV